MSDISTDPLRSEMSALTLGTILRRYRAKGKLKKASADPAFDETSVGPFLEGDEEAVSRIRSVAGMDGRLFDELVSFCREVTGTGSREGSRMFGLVPTDVSGHRKVLAGILLADVAEAPGDGTRVRTAIETAGEISRAHLFDVLQDGSAVEAALREIPSLSPEDAKSVMDAAKAAIERVVVPGSRSIDDPTFQFHGATAPTAPPSFGAATSEPVPAPDDPIVATPPTEGTEPAADAGSPPAVGSDAEAPLDDAEAADAAISALPGNLREVARGRHPLGRGEPSTVAQLAERMNLTPQRIYQIDKKVMGLLRDGSSGDLFRAIAAKADPVLADEVARLGRVPARADAGQQKILEALAPAEHLAFLVVHGTLAAWARARLGTTEPEAGRGTDPSGIPDVEAPAPVPEETSGRVLEAGATDVPAGMPVSTSSEDEAPAEPVPEPSAEAPVPAGGIPDRLDFLDDYEGPVALAAEDPADGIPDEEDDGVNPLEEEFSAEREMARLMAALPDPVLPTPFDRIQPYAGLELEPDFLWRLDPYVPADMPKNYLRLGSQKSREARAVRLHAVGSGATPLFDPVGIAMRCREAFDEYEQLHVVAEALKGAPNLFGRLFDDQWYVVGPNVATEWRNSKEKTLPLLREIVDEHLEEEGKYPRFLHGLVVERGPMKLEDMRAAVKEKFNRPADKLQDQVEGSNLFVNFTPNGHFGPSGVQANTDIDVGKTDHAWGYAVARRAGVPFHWYRSWTPGYENLVCRWAEQKGDGALLSSLLSVAQPAAWDMRVRDAWTERASEEGRWNMPPEVGNRLLGLSSEFYVAPRPDRLVAALVHLVVHGSIGWVQARRILGGGKARRIGQGMLAILAAVGAVDVPDGWDLPHVATERAPAILDALMAELGHAGRLDWHVGVPSDLLMDADAGRLADTWVDVGRFEEMLRTVATRQR